MSLRDHITTELQGLGADDDYKLFRGSLEKLQILANAQIGGQSISTELIQDTLNQIKAMQKEIKNGANPREVFEKVLAESTQPVPQTVLAEPADGDTLLAAGDVYKAEGDLLKAQRDVNKADNIIMFNQHFFFNESYKEIKAGLDQIMIQVVLLVMTAEEARQLDSGDIFQRFNNPVYAEQLAALQKQLSHAQMDNALQRYGATAEDWRPFPDRPEPISKIVADALKQVRGFTKPLAADFRDIRRVAPEQEEEGARASLRLLREEGCMVIMDSISMYHPIIQRAYRRSLLDVYSNIPVLRVAPSGKYIGFEEQDMLNFGDKYPDTEIYKRLNWDPDDSCREESRGPGLLKWIVGNVPELLRRRDYYKQAQASAQATYKDINGAA